MQINFKGDKDRNDTCSSGSIGKDTGVLTIKDVGEDGFDGGQKNLLLRRLFSMKHVKPTIQHTI